MFGFLAIFATFATSYSLVLGQSQVFQKVLLESTHSAHVSGYLLCKKGPLTNSEYKEVRSADVRAATQYYVSFEKEYLGASLFITVVLFMLFLLFASYCGSKK